jgi:steroid delta-isomerase-like uncharacterized protein
MRNIIISILLTGLLISCTTNNDTSDKKKTETQLVKLTEKLITLWETGDTSISQEIFLTECTYVDIANNYSFEGINGVNKYVGHIHNWATEVKMISRKIRVSEKSGFVEWTLTAKQTSPIKGRVPLATNREITLNGVTILEFDEGKIKKASDYMDVLGFVMQLGSKLELPGGKTIGE